MYLDVLHSSKIHIWINTDMFLFHPLQIHSARSFIGRLDVPFHKSSLQPYFVIF